MENPLYCESCHDVWYQDDRHYDQCPRCGDVLRELSFNETLEAIDSVRAMAY